MQYVRNEDGLDVCSNGTRWAFRSPINGEFHPFLPDYEPGKRLARCSALLGESLTLFRPTMPPGGAWLAIVDAYGRRITIPKPSSNPRAAAEMLAARI